MRLYVQTMRQDREATDWLPEAKAARRWGVYGQIVGQSDRHGLIYEVKHEDGTTAWYEPRELRLTTQNDRERMML